jgi:hypothetical protein
VIRRFATLRNVVAFSYLSLLLMLARFFLDFQFVFPDFVPDGPTVWPVVALVTALFGAWMWSVNAASHQSWRGLVGTLVFALLTLVLGVGTAVSYCPTPCGTAWPLMEVTNWGNILLGLISAIVSGFYIMENRD